MGLNAPIFCFSQTVICYLLFVIVMLETEKIRFWKLSTVNCNAPYIVVVMNNVNVFVYV